MAGALGWYWYLSDRLEGRQQLRATLNVADRAGDITPAARGRTLQAMAMVERPGACVVHPVPSARRRPEKAWRCSRLPANRSPPRCHTC